MKNCSMYASFQSTQPTQVFNVAGSTIFTKHFLLHVYQYDYTSLF